MSSQEITSKRNQLEQAIAAQENLRGLVDDQIIETAIEALRNQLDVLLNPQELETQRKYVTILFMDVVDSTQMLLGIDPEDHMTIMDPALKLLATSIEAHHGKVSRFMGDGFLAVFGLPLARENDPEMAVRAGLEILNKARQLAAELEDQRGINGFRVRVGVNTGLVMAGGLTEADNTIMGTAVNLAARLEAAAPPNAMLVSQFTYQHIRGLFNFSSQNTIEMKGFDQPIPVYLVQDAKPQTFQTMTRGVEGITVPMIGRQAELAFLKNGFTNTADHSESRLITIIGEAGIGKSRLLQEFETWLIKAANSPLMLKGRATMDTLDLPQGLLRNLFGRHFEIMDDDPIEIVRAKLLEALSGSGWETDHFEMASHYIGHLLGYDFSDSPYLMNLMDSPKQLYDRGLWYLTDYLKALSTQTSVAMFLDDIHWSDDRSLDILLQLSENLAGFPVLFVALSRATLFERRPDWEELEKPEIINLGPLDIEESYSLVSESLQNLETLPKKLTDLIVEGAEGNPYYMEELVNMFIQDGVIEIDSPVWQVRTEKLGKMRIPQTLAGVLQARLDGLPVEEKTILQQASVVGRNFWEAAITYLNSQPDRAGLKVRPDHGQILERLNKLLQRDMIFENPSSTFSNTIEYSFKHSAFHDSTYESVLKRTRTIYHSLVADWLIEQSKNRSGEINGLIARHLENAGRIEEALEYISRAAETALANYAVDQAVDFYDRALALTAEDDHQRRFDLLMGSEKSFGMQGKIREQSSALQELGSTAELLDDDLKRAQVQLRNAWFAYWTGNFGEMIRFAQEAVKFVDDELDARIAWSVYYALAWGSMVNDDIDAARIYAENALPLARKANDKRGEGNVSSVMGLINLKQGNYFLAYQNLRSYLAIAKQINDQEREINARFNLSVPLTQLGQYQSARDHLTKCIEITEKSGDVSSKSSALVNLAWVYSLERNWQTSIDLAGKGISIKQELGQIEAAAEGYHWLGNSRFGAGDLKGAFDSYSQAASLREELNLPHLEIESIAGLAIVKLEEQDLASALTYVEKILDYLEAGNTLIRGWEPFTVYWRCYQVLKVNQDPRADQVLVEAYHLLMGQAEKIPDPVFRESYLRVPPGHAEIQRAWEGLGSGNSAGK